MVYQKKTPVKRQISSVGQSAFVPWLAKQKRLNLRTGGYLGTEVKWVDHSQALQIGGPVSGQSWFIADPSTALCLNAITQGPSQNQRIGVKVKLLRLDLQIQLQMASYSSITPVHGAVIFRVVIYKDKQTNKAPPLTADVFDSFLGFPDTLSHRAVEWKDRFDVLYDRHVRVDAIGMDWATNTYRRVGAHHQLTATVPLDCISMFKGTADPATVAEITDNSLHIMACCDDEDVGESYINYTSRCWYTDM